VISASTRVAGIIGDPVRHSLSPVLHNAAYRELGLDWVYLAFEVSGGDGPGALAAMRLLGIAGLSVTMPHKNAVVAACDVLTPRAARLQSVNTVTRLGDGRLEGDSTDGEGFLRAVREAGCDPDGLDALVLGAGGAARAVVLALADCGARVRVSARRLPASTATAGLAKAVPVPWDERDDAARSAGLVVNATPIGMAVEGSVTGETPVAPSSWHADHVAVDLVYHPIETMFLRDARSHGAATVNGLGMLVHQAGLQVERWTGVGAPIAVMRAAVNATLASPS
jgi:shikimate dehydrogenase